MMIQNKLATIFFRFIGPVLIVLIGAGCRIRLPEMASTKSALDSEDPHQDHPCSIATVRASFDTGLQGDAQLDSSGLSKRDWSMVRTAAMHSYLAYSTPEEIRASAKRWGYAEIYVVEQGAMQGFIASTQKCVVVSFRGTDFWSGKDWFTNLASTTKKLGPSDGIHKGFLEAFDTMARELRIQLRRLGADEKIVWITGHSLGGALAGVFSFSNELRLSLPPFESALVADRHTFKIGHVITFGQPLFVENNLARKMRNVFHTRYLRVVNNTDLVARVPSWFTHFGDLLWMRPEGINLFTEEMASGGAPGNLETEVVGVTIPDELAANEDGLAEYRAIRARAATEGDQQPVFGNALSDHSMAPYLSNVSQSWQKSR